MLPKQLRPFNKTGTPKIPGVLPIELALFLAEIEKIFGNLDPCVIVASYVSF